MLMEYLLLLNVLFILVTRLCTNSLLKMLVHFGESSTKLVTYSRYHGHVEAQREDAFFGPLIVESQINQVQYDEEKIIMVSDFYYQYGDVQLLMLESAPFRWVGSPQHILVNGHVCPTIIVEEGKVYLFRFISAAALSW